MVNEINKKFRELKYFDFSLNEIEFWKEVCNAQKDDNTIVFPEL